MKYLYRFTVRGRNVFPVDMLRYDSCWPASPEDAINIGSAIRRDRFGQLDPTREVELLTEHHAPTEKRWASFGWTVISQTKMKQV